MTRLLLASTAAAALAACAPSSSAPQADVVIQNVTVVDVARGSVVDDRDVFLQGDRIVQVARAGRSRLADTVQVVDGGGAFLIPGLWDMHAHVDVRTDPEREQMPLFIAHGVTGIRVMNTPRRPAVLDAYRDLQARIDSGAVVGPRFLAIGSWSVNGPASIDSTTEPAFFMARTAEEGQQLARYFKEQGFDFIKIYNNVPREGYLGLSSEARRLGIPFAGHEPGSLNAIELSEAGQRSLEHSRIFLFNCFPGADSMRKRLLTGSGTERRRRMVDEYSPGMCDEVFRTFARNGTYITPTHVTRRMDAFADDSAYRADARRKYIPLRRWADWQADANGMVAGDSTAAGRKSYMDFYTKGLSLTNDAYRAGVPVMLGTDAGDTYVFPGASVHDELLELVKAGLSPAEALRAATLSGATFMGRTDEFGTVEAGRAADLVLLEANPLDDIANTQRIRAVIRGGRVFARAALDSMLASVEEAVRPDAQEFLWAGARMGDTAMVARALRDGARIDSLDTLGNRRALNYAASSNRVAMIRLLIARGASINLANATGFTPLHHAVQGGAVEALRTLLAAGADPKIPNAAGVLPLETARRTGNGDVLALLQGVGM